jgi:hypothetical protein
LGHLERRRCGPAFAWRVRRRWTLISDPPHNLHRAGGKTMAGIREVRVTTAGTRKAAVRVEYDDGSTQVVLADQLSMPSPSDVAAKIRVANQLKKLSFDLPDIGPDQITVESTAAKA